MNAIPPENLALLVGCLTMMVSGIWMAHRLRGGGDQPTQAAQQPPQLPRVIRVQPQQRWDLNPPETNSIKVITRQGQVLDIDPRDLRTLRELGFQPRPREERRAEPEPSQRQQPASSLPSRDIYLCLECGRRVEYVEHAKIYKPGVGLIAIPRCPFCGAPMGPPKVVEKEEAELSSLRAIEPPRFPEKKPKGLGIERPSLEEAGEAEEDEEN